MIKFALLISIATLAGCATAPRPHAAPPIEAGPYARAYRPTAESFIWPVKGRIIVPFGSKVAKVINKGIDIKAEGGADVRASRSGRVVYCDPYMKGFGKTIIIDHGDWQTVYAYNSDILVRVGDEVAQNEVIARAGKTGRSGQPSLHFEIRKNGQPQNPESYLLR